MIFLLMPGLARALTCAQACKACYTPQTAVEEREVVCSMCMECSGGRRSRRKACAEYSNCVNTYGNQVQGMYTLWCTIQNYLVHRYLNIHENNMYILT